MRYEHSSRVYTGPCKQRDGDPSGWARIGREQVLGVTSAWLAERACGAGVVDRLLGPEGPAVRIERSSLSPSNLARPDCGYRAGSPGRAAA